MVQEGFQSSKQAVRDDKDSLRSGCVRDEKAKLCVGERCGLYIRRLKK